MIIQNQLHLVTRDNLLEELVFGEGVEEETVQPILELQPYPPLSSTCDNHDEVDHDSSPL
jgi:hypothetical protein